jgi:hypothetical protein
MEWFDVFREWFLNLGKQYGVNPYIFGAIYVGAIPFFTMSVAWIVRNYNRQKSLTMPILSASGFFVSAYVYLFIAGENVPWWVYAVVVGMLVYGGWSTYGKITRQIKEDKKGAAL